MESPKTTESRIHLIRGQRVMLDADLADIYGVETRALNQAVRRNIGRFPRGHVGRRLEVIASGSGKRGDGEIRNLFEALGAMIEGPQAAGKRIGFQP